MAKTMERTPQAHASARPKAHAEPQAPAPDRERSAREARAVRGIEPRKVRMVGAAGQPPRVARRGSVETARTLRKATYHAVPRRPPLHERLAARVKQQTRRLEEPRQAGLKATALGALSHLRESVLPNDPRDIAMRKRSGEPVVALVGAVDLPLLLTVVVLLVIGLVMVYSSSMVMAILHSHFDSTSYYLLRQFNYLLLGGVGMYLAMRIDYRHWRLLSGLGLVASIVTLLLLHTGLGTTVLGSTRWLRLGPVEVEPSEVAKMSLILYTAHWFSGQRAELRHSLRGLIPFGIVVAAIVALVFRQPDLGTTVVILVSLATIYFVAGARLRHLAVLGVVGAVAVKFYLHHMPAYQRVRWDAFLHPMQQAQGAGYQYVQMQQALATGGISGTGLGNGVAKFVMPEAPIDSIFAILGEEWGIIGTLGVLLLFCFLVYRGMRASILAPDAFGRLLAAGITCALGFQALLNMAVVAQVVPLTGVPLPFISYGGTSLTLSMIAAGILLNVSKQAVSLQEERDPAPAYFWWRYRRSSLPFVSRRPASVPGAVGGMPIDRGSGRPVPGIQRASIGTGTRTEPRRPASR